MKKQTLANIAVAAAFLFTLNLGAQPRGPQKEPWELGPGGKGAPAAKPATKPAGPAVRPNNGPARPAVNPQPNHTPQKPFPGVNNNPGNKHPLPPPAVRTEPAKPGLMAQPGPVHKPGPAVGPKPGPVVHPTPGPKPGPVVHPTPGPKPGPVVHPTPGPKPGPVVHPTPGPKPGPVVHPTPGPAPHIDHHHDKPRDGFFHRLFEPAPPRPHGFRTFPHRHPKSKFTFLWYDYLPGGRVYELKDYVIYECRFCHLVHYSPVIPANALCPNMPGQIHSYQILGYYGDLAFRCATCGVTINSNAIPNVGYCGTQYHIWQQLLEY